MKSFKKVIDVETKEKEEALDVTLIVQKTLKESKIQEGICLVYSLHTSSGIMMTDSDSSLTQDMSVILKKIIPENESYLHNKRDLKKNATAHLKSSLTGLSITVPVTDGRLDLGTYQRIYYNEYDGKRKKEFIVKIVGQ